MPRPLGRGRHGQYKDYMDKGTQVHPVVSMRYLDTLDRAAKEKGMSFNQVLRWIIEDWCKQNEMEHQYREVKKTQKALRQAARDTKRAWGD